MGKGSDIVFRSITPEDMDFLFEVYAATRDREMRLTGWDAAQIHFFLKMQFNLQHNYYQENYRNARFLVICFGGREIGRLYRQIRSDEIRIIDIALLPGFRGRGIGTKIIREIMAEATGAGLAVRLHVEKMNPAIRVYQRLGFMPVKDAGMHRQMQYGP